MLRVLMMNVNMLLFSLNDILDHKLIETNSFTPKTQDFRPHEVFKFIIDLVQQTSFGEGEEIQFEVRTLGSLESHESVSLGEYQIDHSGTLPESVSGDKIRLIQVLMNLVKLAQKL